MGVQWAIRVNQYPCSAAAFDSTGAPAMSNTTSPDLQPASLRAGPEYVLIPFLLITLSGILVALGVYIRRRRRLDELRHRLIPLYSYHPSGVGSDSDEEKNEEEELTEPLRNEETIFEGQLSFNYSSDQ
ncbi:hypothetical protein AGOR_G00184820 [Albula goreensis]|uniref:Small integral membrane protein 29 n=1 Tax=Albula goreensis TaxID=1534307 RepID=A0A8T3CVT5_9TELE|nr:hypothetical protein AGOR_G00184820 [Albula goreensis]